MGFVHSPVVPAVLAFLVVLFGIGTLEPAQAQSTAGIPAITQPTPSLLQPLTANSFLLYSTRWNCTPSVAVVDGMLTLSSVKILPTYFLFYLRRLLLSNVMIMKEMLYEV
ncbi:hypothetical protein P5673_027985, partial [Acropora cervicornis]